MIKTLTAEQAITMTTTALSSLMVVPRLFSAKKQPTLASCKKADLLLNRMYHIPVNKSLTNPLRLLMQLVIKYTEEYLVFTDESVNKHKKFVLKEAPRSHSNWAKIFRIVTLIVRKACTTSCYRYKTRPRSNAPRRLYNVKRTLT